MFSHFNQTNKQLSASQKAKLEQKFRPKTTVASAPVAAPIELMHPALNEGAQIDCRDAHDRTILDILAANDQYVKLKEMLAIYPRRDAEATDFLSAYRNAKTDEARELIANCILTQAVKQDSAPLAQKAFALGAQKDKPDAQGISGRSMANYFSRNASVVGFFSNENNAETAQTATSTKTNKL